MHQTFSQRSRLLHRGGLLSSSGGLLLRRGDPRARLHCYGVLYSTRSASSIMVPCFASPASVPRSYTFTWTWPAVPPPVPPPLHHPPGLCNVWCVWKPLLGGGGALSWIKPMILRSFTTRSLAHHIDSCTTLTVARHLRTRGLHGGPETRGRVGSQSITSGPGSF